MTTSIVLTTDQFNAANADAGFIADAAPTTVTPSNTQFVYFAAFDGTNNGADPLMDGSKDHVTTAVKQVSDQVRAANLPPSEGITPNVVSAYWPGPGTEGTVILSDWFPASVTEEAKRTAKAAYDDFAAQATKWLKTHQGGSITSMITSFSRGAGAAAIFSQMLYEQGLVNAAGDVLIPPGTVGAVSASLIIDPVLTGTDVNTEFPPGQKITVVRADNEYRTFFKAADYGSGNPDVNYYAVVGNHGDAGSLYGSTVTQRDEMNLGAIYLQAYTSYFHNAGLNIASVPTNRQYLASESTVAHSEAVLGSDSAGLAAAPYDVTYVQAYNLTASRQTNSFANIPATGTSFTAYNGDVVLYGTGGSSSADGKKVLVLAGSHNINLVGNLDIVTIKSGASLTFTDAANSLSNAFILEQNASLTVNGSNENITANNANITLGANDHNISVVGKNNHITLDATAQLNDPNGTVAAQNTIEVRTSSNVSTVFSTGTSGGVSGNGSIMNVSMAGNGLLPLGTLAIDTAFVADPNHPDLTGVRFALADGFTFDLPTILVSDTVHAVTNPLATPLEVLASYLSDLGFTYDLNILNSSYLHPEGDAHTLNPSVSLNSGGASVTDSFAPDAPGAVITGHSQETVTINGTPTTLPVSLRVIGGTFVDLSKDTVNNIDLLNVTQGAALTADQFLGFSTISGTGILHAVGGGLFNLQNGNIDQNAQFNLTADTWEGTLLTGDNRNGEVLTASLFGDDTLTAGNGNNDKLYAGLGKDTLVGGTGTGMEFHAEQGLAVGSTVTGNGASDVLYASGDLSHVTITGIETLDANHHEITLSASQLAGIGSIINATNVHFTGSGSFNFSKFNNITSEGRIADNGGSTLTAGSAGGYALVASDSGNDTLIGSSAGGDTMIAGHGVVTMIANGADSGFEAQYGLAAGSTVQGHGDSGLITHGDLTQSSVSGISEFELLGGNSVTMSGATFNALNGDVADFGTQIYNLRDGTPGDLKITTAGNYALTLLNGSSGYNPDQMFDMTALSNGGTTLREDHATGVILTASASGNDTLISNHSDFVILDASGTSGTKTLTMDQSTNGELDAEDATGTIVFNSTNNTGNILDAIGSTGTVTFNASTDTGDEIFMGNGANTVYAGLSATIYGGDGTDTVVAGLGNTIYGGDGNDTYYVNIANQIYGGTGNDLFVANLPFDQYTVIDGGGGANSLYVNNYAAWGTANDISLADISNVTTLTDNALNLSMTADQFAGFSTLTNTTGTLITETLIASSAGTFSLAGKTVNGSFNLSGGLTTGNVTLIGSNQNNQVLTGGLGTTTLQAGNGSNDTLIAGSGGGSLIGGAAADTFVLGGVSGLVQLALANGNITYNGSTQVMSLGNVTTTVQYGQNATIVGSDGTMSVNNNASGGVSKNTINWTAGGSRVEQFYTLSGGAWKETNQQLSGANGTGSVLWADTVIHNADGSLHVDISGTGGVFGQSNAAFAAGNGTSATLTGDYNSVQIGDNSTIVFAAGADHDFAFCGSNNNVTFNGVYESFVAYGGYNTLYLNGDSNTEQDDNAVDGDNSPGHNTFVLNANHNTLSLSVSNDVATVSGNNNSVILRKSNDSATVNSGTGNYIGDEGTGGNTIVLNGTGNTAQLKSSGTLTMGGSSNFAYCTDSNTVTVGGTSDSFITYGHGNTVTVSGTSDTLTDASTSGANTIALTGSSSTANINNAAGDTLTVGGTNNTINVNVAMTAAGTATISGTNAVLKFSGATTDQVTFSSGASGKLVLNSAQSFAGTVAGLASGDSIDLKNFHFSGSPTISNVTGTGAQGTATNVTVTDGALSVTLALMNQYANQFAVNSSAYALSADGTGGNAGTLFQLAAGQ